MDRLVEGESIDEDAVLRKHPELGPAVLRELRTFRDLDDADGTRTVPLGTLGDYTLRRQIGRGGMGVVYEAWQNSLDRQVALKVLPAGIAADDKAFHRFMREAKTAAKLSHPHIVGVYGMGVEQNTPYFAMEFVEGETLAQLLTKLKDAAPEADTVFGKKDDVRYFANLVEAFAAVADGLQHAHSKGIIHRDIKPSNLILDGQGRLRILDFGLARLEGQESLTISGDVVGTPLYMSPEQARRKKIPVDHRTDVYSLGATLYEMLTLRPPFSGKDHQDTLSQIIERDPVEPRKVNPRIPKDLETIVLKCLRKDAVDRYGTAEAMGQDLRRFVRGELIEARTMPPWQRVVRRVLRQRARFTMLGLTVLLIVVGGALGTVLWSRHGELEQARYEELLGGGLDGLEVGLLTLGELNEGETIALGILVPSDDVFGGSERRTSVEEAVRSLRQAVATLPQRPEARVHLSRALWALGRRQEAEVALDQALERDAGFTPALLLKAYCLRQSKRPELAEALTRVIEATADRPWKRVWLEAHHAAVRGDWDAVDPLYTALLQGNERPFAGFEKEMRLKRGRAALKRGQHQRALRDFSFAREAARGAIGPTILLAAAYYLADLRSEAAAVLAEALGQSPSAGTMMTVAQLHLDFGDVTRAREAVEKIADEATRQAALVMVLLYEGKPADAVEAGRKSLALGFAEPWVYGPLGEALMWASRLEEARPLLEAAVSKHPSDRSVLSQLMRTMLFQCAFDELIALCERQKDPKLSADFIGWCLLLQGKTEAAHTRLSEVIELFPRYAGAYQGRLTARRALGDLKGALADELRLHAINPAWSGGQFLAGLLGEQHRPLFDGHWDELEAICATAVRRGVRPVRFLGLRAIACLYKRQPEPDLALKLARESVEKAEVTGDLLAEALGYLGEAQGESGNPVEAIHALERGAELPYALRSSAERLRRYRLRWFPKLATLASADAYLGGELSQDGDWRRDLDRVRGSLPGAGHPLTSYLEAGLLERDARWAEAAALLEPLASQVDARDRTALMLRCARLRNRLGDRNGALALIEEHSLCGSESLAPWIEWLRIGSGEEGANRHLQDRIAALRARCAAGKPDRKLENIAWLLEELSSQGALRINCGGGDYVDARGRTWAGDRFFLGGGPDVKTQPPIRGNLDPPLYYAHLRFGADKWAMPGYRIPLPRGRYEVTLPFCGVRPRACRQRFAIEVEGQLIRDGLEPLVDPGLGVPFEVRAEVEVTDGALEVLFTRIEDEAFANAIEVRRVN